MDKPALGELGVIAVRPKKTFAGQFSRSTEADFFGRLPTHYWTSVYVIGAVARPPMRLGNA
jgi:hypothetical protein